MILRSILVKLYIIESVYIINLCRIYILSFFTLGQILINNSKQYNFILKYFI